MKRFAAVAVLLGGLSGCFNLDTGVESGGMRPLQGQGIAPINVPGVQGPYGTPVPMASPYNTSPPGNMWSAQQMMGRSVDMRMIQMNGGPGGGLLSPAGLPAGPGAPPGAMGMPMAPGASAGNAPTGDIQQAQYAAMNPAVGPAAAVGQRTQVRFHQPVGMQVSWYAQGPDGRPLYSPTPIDTPGKYNFLQGARYRLKLTNIKGRPGVELYPTLEVAPSTPKTDAFLAHNNVPVEFTDEDFKQVADGNYLVKVVYLPDPQFQDVAGTGTEEILSTRLEPGQDPIQEALRRGSILLVIRMGNIDQEAPNTPPLTSPPPPGAAAGPGGLYHGPTMPGVLPPGVQVPFWGMPPPHGPGGAPAPGMVPPGMMPPGMVPPGMVPPGMVPPGMVPPGMVPPGMVPPGMVPPGMVPPGMVPPGMAPLFPPVGMTPPGAMPPGALPPGFVPGAGAPAGPFQSNLPTTMAPTNAAPTTNPSVSTPAPITPSTSKTPAPLGPGIGAPKTPAIPTAIDAPASTAPATLTPIAPPTRPDPVDSLSPIRPALPPANIPGIPR